MTFVNYEKAFDSVTVLELTRKGVDEVNCRVLKDIHEDGTTTIKPHNNNTIPIQKRCSKEPYHLNKIVYILPWGNIQEAN